MISGIYLDKGIAVVSLVAPGKRAIKPAKKKEQYEKQNVRKSE